MNVSTAFLNKWSKYFGVPGIVFTDLGGEFENYVVRTMADRYRIDSKMAASGAYWSIGGVEQQHTKLPTLTEMLIEVYPSMILTECVHLGCTGKNYFPSAKLRNSPHQIVYAASSRWPDYDDCDFPALGSYDV